MMRRFHLVRHDDPSGVSGTGIVAEGVQYTDGHVTIRWYGNHPSTVDWDTIDDAMAVHGHGGKTVHRWLDPQHQAFITPYRQPIHGDPYLSPAQTNPTAGTPEDAAAQLDTAGDLTFGTPDAPVTGDAVIEARHDGKATALEETAEYVAKHRPKQDELIAWCNRRANAFRGP